ncbi:MAG: L-threonylcarbamoyladenylate synthase [Nitrospirota bacterium]
MKSGLNLRRAAEVIRDGGVIIFPTDTFYGLGADATNPSAVRKVFMVKGRSADKPISVLVPDRRKTEALVSEMPHEAVILMDHFWPGPLTLIFKASPSIPEILTAGTGKIGIRIPDNPLTIELLNLCGVPLTATSANPSGGMNASTVDEVEDSIKQGVDLIIDGGRTKGEKESTVLDIAESPLVIIREGMISREALGSILNHGERC